MAPLGGGPRDLNPPKLLEAIPANVSTNFNSRMIELKFDEFVQVKDVANQIVITPQLKETPVVEARGKKIIVKFNGDLKPNTTYRIFFGNAIADMHEGNVLNNMEYVFSTGATIDSFKIAGKIRNAFTLSPEKDVMVALYDSRESDSVVYKAKPLYFSKSVENGLYDLSYLPKSSFKMFAFSDKNKNLMYDGGEEMIGFKDSLADVSKDTMVDIDIFKEEPNKKYIKKVNSPNYGSVQIVYNKPLLNKAEAAISKERATVCSKEEINDTCSVFYYNVFDTLHLYVKHSEKDIDTVNVPVMSQERFEKQLKEKKLKLGIDIPDQGGKIPYYNKAMLRFNFWLDTTGIDESKINLYSKTDSLVDKNPHFTASDPDALIINTKLQPETFYFLTCDKGAFKTMSGIESDSLKLSFTTSSPDDYGTLKVKLLFPKKESYVVQLLNERGNVVAEEFISLSLTSSAEQTFVFKNLLPSSYSVKVIEDKNGNRKWDTGNLINKIQPELIYFNSQSTKVPAGWDSEIEWNVK